MPKTIWHFTMSLDGFLADQHGSVDWLPTDAGPAPMGTALIPTIGAILVGRGTYDAGIGDGGRGGIHGGGGGIDGGGGAPYGGAYTGPVFVLTTRAVPPNPRGLRFLTAGLDDALARARAAAGARNVVMFGARLGQACLRAGELDEILIHIAPVLLGTGTTAFAVGKSDLRRLVVLERSPADQLTTLRLAGR
jgi:dihydrofolate reductase